MHARKQRFQVRDVLGVDQILVKPGSQAFASYIVALVGSERDQEHQMVSRRALPSESVS